jgi:hypothetical protein
VKAVILIFVNRARAEIEFEIWENVPLQNPRITRAQAGGQQVHPAQTQEASAKLEPPLQNVAIAGAPLTLRFRSLFLRDPNPPIETDVSLSQQDLESIAKQVWREQGFI